MVEGPRDLAFGLTQQVKGREDILLDTIVSKNCHL